MTKPNTILGLLSNLYDQVNHSTYGLSSAKTNLEGSAILAKTADLSGTTVVNAIQSGLAKTADLSGTTVVNAIQSGVAKTIDIDEVSTQLNNIGTVVLNLPTLSNIEGSDILAKKADVSILADATNGLAAIKGSITGLSSHIDSIFGSAS
jgi:hypothetical protein